MKIAVDLLEISIGSGGGHLLSEENFNSLQNGSHIEFSFYHEYYSEPDSVDWNYVVERKWDIRMFFFWFMFHNVSKIQCFTLQLK